MFSYALRQIQPRSVSPSRARLLVISVVDSSTFSERRDPRRDDYEQIVFGNNHLLSTRAENVRPSLTGQERSGSAGRLPLLFFLFTNCTVTSVLFINFYFCCYVCLLLLVSVTVLRMRMRVMVYMCLRVKCLCPVSIKWSCEDGIIRVVSY